MRYGSVCSGIEAASLAWEPLGWQPAWFSEIEKFPAAVLAEHWPTVPNLGDMTMIADAVRDGLVEAPDVLVGGTPCQAFSVAGLRNGLNDARGQLTLAYVELANEIDNKRRKDGKEPVIAVWENVPGVLNSKDNAFGCFLAGLAGESSELQPAGGKWTHAGCVSGPERAIAWRVLDAQFFNVAQRRQRVFVVASARAGFDPAAVLFELESVRRDTPPRRETQPEVASNAGNRVDGGSHWDNPANPHPTLNQSNNIGGIGASNQEIFSQRGSGLVSGSYSEISRTLLAKENDSTAEDLDTYVLAYGGGNTGGNIDVATACTAHGVRMDFDTETFAVSFAENSRGEIRLQNSDGQITGALSTGGGKPGQGIPALVTREPFTLAIRGRTDGSSVEVRNDGVANALLTPNGGRGGVGVGAIGWGLNVRRLMPIECERLQGMPDNHTMIPWRGKPADKCPDGPRYRAIGNSMAVPVMRWIGERIAMGTIIADPVVESAAPVNPYIAALEELRARPAHFLREIGDQWESPDELWWGINAMFGPLVLDLFADDCNAKCPDYYTAETNALTQDWSARLAELNGAAFGNPPYSREKQFDGQFITGMVRIMEHTAAMRDAGGRYVFLIKSATSESWWPQDADHIAFIRGRIGFDAPGWFKPADKKQVPTGAFFAGAIAVFDKTWSGPAMSYISRDDLEARGAAFLAQIRREAERMAGRAA